MAHNVSQCVRNGATSVPLLHPVFDRVVHSSSKSSGCRHLRVKRPKSWTLGQAWPVGYWKVSGGLRSEDSAPWHNPSKTGFVYLPVLSSWQRRFPVEQYSLRISKRSRLAGS